MLIILELQIPKLEDAPNQLPNLIDLSLGEPDLRHRIVYLLEILRIVDVCSFVHPTLFQKRVMRWIFGMVLFGRGEGVEGMKGSLIGRD
jgi:hypothetical protein